MGEAAGEAAATVQIRDIFEKFRWADQAIQEGACASLAERVGKEAGDKLRELFEADRAAATASGIPKVAKKPDVAAKAKPESVGAKREWRQIGGGWEYRPEGETVWRRHFGPRPGAVPQLRVVDQAKPEPEAEPKQEETEGAEPEADDRIKKPIRLDLEAPYDVARLFVRFNEDKRGVRRYAFVGKIEGKSIRRPTLYHWKSDFKCWNGRCYDDVDDEQIRAQVYDFLDQAVYPNNVRIKPKPKHVNEVIDGLRAGTNLVGDAPCWIEAVERPEPKGLLVCKNGLLELETGKLWDHDPRLFCLNGVDFDFDPGARAPRWQQFLGEVWPRNEEAIGTLQEFFGLWLTDETKYQKALGLIGPPRSGKGTIGRVLKGLLGSTGYVAIGLQSLGEDFGMANLIGKKLALVPDVKLDRRMNITRIMERLLTTIGEDDQTINRKNDKYWQGRLTIRWLILGNDIPKFRGTDEAGALVARMIMVPLYESFYGREDFDLTMKLLGERAGILNWAMEGLRRLRERGKFVQPASGMALVQKLKASGSTIGSFVLECCVLGPKSRFSVRLCGWLSVNGASVVDCR
jgi:putative DNA primase/helicase